MDGYDSTCPRCGAVLTAGGCMSCGYPSLRLDAKVGADTTGGGVEFVKFEVLVASMKRIAELEAENAKLRKCLAEARLAMMEPHGEWKDVREAKALSMIRAEVDKP